MKLRIRNGIRKVSAWNNVKCTKDILFGRGIICVSVKWPEEKSFLINNWYKGSRVVGTDQGGGEEGSENVQVRQILRCVAIKPPHSSRVTFCIDSGGRCHEQISRLNLYSKLSTSWERKRKKKREREKWRKISWYWNFELLISRRKSNPPWNVCTILVSSFDFNSLCKLSSLPRGWVSFGFLKR